MMAFLNGFGLGLSLILAIGAQNSFVLRQGLRRQHVTLTVLFCGFSDAFLIAAIPSQRNHPINFKNCKVV